MEVKVRCVTKLNNFKKEWWPAEMAARPIKGDIVRSEGGKELEVLRVTHTTTKGRTIDAIGTYERHPIIEVYLGRERGL